MIKLPQKTAQAAQPETLTVRAALAEMGWKSDAELMREAAERAFGFNLHLLARWVESDRQQVAPQQVAAREIVDILQAEVADHDRADEWIESHRDEMTPALLAAIIRTAMEHQRHVTAAKGGKTKRKNGRPARMLERYEQLGSQGVVGQRRDEALLKEFGGSPTNLSSTISKARTAARKASERDT